MTTPAVSFIVPCYKLAHLLPECINSILAQSYDNFEVLIMDDCSPDNTVEVAQSFHDNRVRHIRNSSNLGHLHNYNKGINFALGKYVWLISADDYLRASYVLERYVDLLDNNSRIGYTYCAGLGVRNGMESGVIGRYPGGGDRDSVIPGHVMLKQLLRWNFVLAASGLVRRECYDKLGVFPLDMPWAGDWYLWCLFALHYDVGYFAEPMVCYRDHSLSMTTKLTRERLEACAFEDVAIPWIMRKKAQDAGYARLAKDILPAIAHTYARVISSERYRESAVMTLQEFEESLWRNITDESERNLVRALAYVDMGNEYYFAGYSALAKELYEASLRINPLMVSVHIKKILLSLGTTGDYLRRMLLSFR
ncbi:MAG: Glycosyl transferase family 2 [Nitrospira sp.]|nr:MAG: Glycosyl transferase family 2 [Nitrospira sp.]